MTHGEATWTQLSRSTVFQRFGRNVDEVHYRLPNGHQDAFYIKNERPAVSVLALTESQQVILVRQYRPGPDRILAELPGGYLGHDENPEYAAERELLEETGYRPRALQYVADCWDDAYSTMFRKCFVAIGCVKVSDPDPEITETLEVVLTDMQDFRRQLRNGLSTDVEVGYMCLDYLELL
ncbi:NUDIX hydrolase [Streptomyces sp. NPDC058614]|uniref:NUDIX hydrolase n=1 Tax=Streptomyces sp. NPDC058614 TaxID=3346557 RepID=UPI00365AB09C